MTPSTRPELDPASPGAARRTRLRPLLVLGLFAACRADSRPTPEPTLSSEARVEAPSEPPLAVVGEPAAIDPKSPPSPPVGDTLAKALAEPPDDRAQLGAAQPDTKPVDPAEPARPRKVLILGDSLAATGFGALLERKLDAHPDIDCFRKGKSASGLARPDFFDWPAEAKKQVEFRQPDLIVVIMGGNDGQDLTRKTGRRVPWNEPEAWRTDYRTRMDAFLADLDAPERRILWLGLPTMGLRSLEQKLQTIREVQTEAVQAMGERARYLDTAPFVTTADGALLTEAKVGRKLEPIRAEDRIHFTMSGAAYFADRVYPEVLQTLGLEDAAATSP